MALLAGLAHQGGLAGSQQGLVLGAISGPVIGAAVMLMLAFGGKFLIRPALPAGSLLGLAVGLVAGAVGIHLEALWQAMAAGYLLGAAVGYLLCRLCDTKDTTAPLSQEARR